MDRRAFLRLLGGVASSIPAFEAFALQAKASELGPTKRRPVHTAELDLPIASWVREENARPGSTDWIIGPRNPSKGSGIAGYLDQVSVTAGSAINLYVHTAAPSWRAAIYRIGYYQGNGARLIHETPYIDTAPQPAPTMTAGINMVECHWRAPRRIAIGTDWPPGYYLIKLIASTGSRRYVPFLVRDDASRAALVIQSSVATWQAYNPWGGYSLYGGIPRGDETDYESRSRIVSFDRPYGHPPLDAYGSGDFLGNEFPLVYLAERHGLDVTYWTDVDLHERPALLLNHRSLVTLGHDEYWSASMRSGALAALGKGVNLAFFGANACYRQVRFEASPLGPNRRMVCYKDAAEDPITASDPALSTSVSWALGPDPRPESELIGLMYQSFGADNDFVVGDPSAWVFAGTGLRKGSRITGLIGSEFDAFEPGLPGPRNVQIFAHSPAHSVNGPRYSDMGYYVSSSGGAVFASGTADFVTRLWDGPHPIQRLLGFGVSPSESVLSKIALNVLGAFGSGPAGKVHASRPNWEQYYSAHAPARISTSE